MKSFLPLKIIFFVAALFFLILLGITRPVEKFFVSLYGSAAASARKPNLEASKLIEHFFSNKRFIPTQEEINFWRETVSENAQYKMLKDENDNLRAQLQFARAQNFTLLPANVIGETTLKGLKALVIDKGKNEGVAEDLAVITKNGIMVGKILKVSEKNSTVILLTDGASRVAATILNNDHTIGIAEGGRGLSVKMTLIPQTEIVRAHDIIITSGLEQLIPRGLIIGTVESVTVDTRSPFQTASIKPVVDYRKETVLTVVKLK